METEATPVKDRNFDPVDHHHTTNPHTGVAFKSMLALPILVVIVGGIVVAVSALASAGYMQPQWAAVLGVVAVAIGILGAAMAIVERRRVRRGEARWTGEQEQLPPS